jgi:hypothetical protein
VEERKANLDATGVGPSRGLAALAAIVMAAQNGAVLEPSVYPLTMPQLVPLAAVGILIALLPARFAPRPPTLVEPELGDRFEVAA